MMVSSVIWKGVHRTVVTLGMAFMLIGVVLLTVSTKVFILGICFLAAGSMAIICYLLVTLSTCVKKSRSQNEENPTQTDARNTGQQNETNPSHFEAPRYEDVILSATVWTVTLGPLPDIEPPPYNSALEHERAAIGDLQCTNPTLPALLRISSDIHEIKRSELIPEQRFPEPLTPPPTYNESMFQWEEDFLPTQEEG